MLLSHGQYKVVSLILGGASPGQAARRLGVSPCTVSNAVREAKVRVPNLTLALAISTELHKQHQRA